MAATLASARSGFGASDITAHAQEPAMSHKHDSMLQTLFHDPVSGNIHWREVESLLVHLGARIDPSHGARFHVSLNGVDGFLHHPHHNNTLNREDIKHLREFLTRAGISASHPGGAH